MALCPDLLRFDLRQSSNNDRTTSSSDAIQKFRASALVFAGRSAHRLLGHRHAPRHGRLAEPDGRAARRREGFRRRSRTRSGAARRRRDGLEFHSDRCDVVGLLCVRKAKSGGASRIVSSAAIHNEILRRRPDLIDVFYDDWVDSWQGEEPPGQRAHRIDARSSASATAISPGCSQPAYVKFAQEFPEVPRHTPQQIEALDALRQLTNELALAHALRAGRHPTAQQPPHVSRPHAVRRLARGESQAAAAATVAVGAGQPAAARRLRSRVRHDPGGRAARRRPVPRRVVARRDGVPQAEDRHPREGRRELVTEHAGHRNACIENGHTLRTQRSTISRMGSA